MDKKSSYSKRLTSKLKYKLEGAKVYVSLSNPPKISFDLWGIKCLFDKGMINKDAMVYVDEKVSETTALRMYYLKYLFPDIEFHDTQKDRYIDVAEEVIKNIGMKQYITYEAGQKPFDKRETKNKLESRIEKELSENLSKYIPDFPVKSKVIRQFPANIFKDDIREQNRVTSKLWIDMVSINKDKELSPIELKVGGNIPLNLFAQGLDYGIYCHLFNRHIRKNWFNGCCDTKNNKVTIYYIGQEFHPALVGKNEEKGIISLIRKNKLFNIVFVQIDVNKESQKITGEPKIIFDTREQ